MNNLKELGTIERALFYRESHIDAWTSSVGINFDGGGYQTLGGLSFGKGKLSEKLMKSYSKDLFAIFEVQSMQELVGKKCYALRPYDRYNEIVVGLEAVSGKRFLHSVWLKKMFPKMHKDPNEDLYATHEKEKQNEIKILEERIQELKYSTVKYINWETEK